tara:strand:+ start:3597 stop:3878 length:282 start_codon:yes stop_codon:yes gene_type:complete
MNIETKDSVEVDKMEHKNEEKPKKKKKKKKSNRCSLEGCNKKLAWSDMPCKCNLKFCSKHRLPHQHNCCLKIEVNKDMLMSVGGGIFQKVTTI